ncbi:MAG: DUF3578 domain-containing protein [Actinobacteria bacterium]|nr:DUF3578 domain-containing protein [Actinomycetota bacterium]
MSIREHIGWILENYLEARQSASFSSSHPVYRRFMDLGESLSKLAAVKMRHTLKVKWSVGQGNWARIPWIAFLDERETRTTQSGVYPVFLFQEDMKGVYFTFNQGVTELKNDHGTIEARRILRERAKTLQQYCVDAEKRGFRLDTRISLHAGYGLGKEYEYSTVAYKLYEKGKIPADEEIIVDVEYLLGAYDRYLESRKATSISKSSITEEIEPVGAEFNIQQATEDLIRNIHAKGFIFEPWQIAQYVTALRTKPFIILAGITGTGKSKLPRLVAEATAGECLLIPVKPDWSDSSDVLGYTDLQGDFRPGPLLEIARDAMENPDRYWTCIIDEMNLARVEQYFAEVLSRIEDRRRDPNGGYASIQLLSKALKEDEAEWGEVVIPSNLAIVGTVNMDESAHGFSRKVLDRAFTVELSEIFLDQWENASTTEKTKAVTWPVKAMCPRAIMLAALTNPEDRERSEIVRAVNALMEINRVLAPAQLQVGYRTRDEVALFLLHSLEIIDSFRDMRGNKIDPLDLALQMKILPRIIGGSDAVNRVVMGMLGWAYGGVPFKLEDEARQIVKDWDDSGRPSAIGGSRYPRLAARLCLMWERLKSEGYTSYWL